MPAGAAEALRQSLAAATAKLDGALPELLAAAQHAFTVGMQITSVIASVLLVGAAVIAWRVIPSPRGGGGEPSEVSVDAVPSVAAAERVGQ